MDKLRGNGNNPVIAEQGELVEFQMYDTKEPESYEVMSFASGPQRKRVKKKKRAINKSPSRAPRSISRAPKSPSRAPIKRSTGVADFRKRRAINKSPSRAPKSPSRAPIKRSTAVADFRKRQDARAVVNAKRRPLRRPSKPKSNPLSETRAAPIADTKKKMNPLLIGGIVLGGLALFGVAIYFLKKKKK